MSDTKHSPIPWTYVEWERIINDANGDLVADLVEPDDGPVIVRAVNAHDDDLLAALVGLMWRFQEDDSDPNVPEEVSPDILVARAAIAKAKQKRT